MTNIKRFLFSLAIVCALSLTTQAQTAAGLMPMPKLQFFDANGVPLSGGLVYSYRAGTTTPLTTYADASGTTSNPNPIVLDAGGSASIWLTPSTAYKIVVASSAGVTQWTQDNVSSIGQSTSLSAASITTSQSGGVPRTGQSKMNDTVSLKDYCGTIDGTTDNSACIATALTTGAVVDGAGLTYAAVNVSIPNNVTLQNLTLLVIPGSASPTVGVLIDGTSSAKSNITLRNVKINGQRASMTGFGSPSDGNKSCILAQGTVTNLTIDNVTANFCGTDGLQLFSYSRPATDKDSDLRFHNINVRNSTFKYSRRQGISADSLYNVTFQNVTAEYNGLDMSEIQSMSGSATMTDLGDFVSGTYTAHATCGPLPTATSPGDCAGKTLGGNYYQNGIDVEGYGVGSGFHGINITGCTMLHNATGGINFTEGTNPATTGFVVRQGIRVTGTLADAGIYPNGSVPWPYALNIDSSYAEYADISIAGNVLLGVASVFGGNAAAVVGNRIVTTAGYAVYTGSTTNLTVEANETDGVRPVKYYDTLGTQNAEWFTKIAPTTNANTFSNYALDFGANSAPVGMGTFPTFFAVQGFGLPIALDPAKTWPVLVGSGTNQNGELQVAGGLTIQADQFGSVQIGRYSAGNTNAIVNAQDYDGTIPASIAFAFAGTTKASVTNGGAYTSNGSTGVTTTLSCTAGQHISGITVVGGVVTAVGACN